MMVQTKLLLDDMGVSNIGFLIENLGADASELQYLRELVQNSFEAIERCDDKSDNGQVVIDFIKIKGVNKLRIVDNGVGMTPEEVAENINRLSASGGTQAFDKNFGIGAKITAATRNPHGVEYRAWKDGQGSTTLLGRRGGSYGRIGHEIDGRADFWLPLPEEEKPDIIDKHGVSVVLLGRSADDDTTAPHAGVDLPSQWIAAYLERRYFEVPNGITLKVLRPSPIYDSARDEERFIYDTIRGQRYYLDKHSDAHGIVRVPDAQANVWWWLLTDSIGEGGKTWNNRGHVAALYQRELYEGRSGQSRGAALKDFGIYAGHPRIVIYVEPLDVIKANTSRTSLIVSGHQPIDYSGIGSAFAERMPDELAGFMAGQVSSERSDHRKAIKKNLQEVEEALKQARFRKANQGKPDDFLPEPGGASPAIEPPRGGRSPSDVIPIKDATGRVGDDYFRKAREEQKKRMQAQRVASDPMPKIVWDVSGDTVPPGRAATYTRASNTVTASPSYAGYLDLLEWSIHEAESRSVSEMKPEPLHSIAEDEVQRWFEQALTEAVVVLRPMEHDPKWGPAALEKGLSDEGLTAAVMSHRWHMMSSIKRGLAARLGRQKETVAAQGER